MYKNLEMKLQNIRNKMNMMRDDKFTFALLKIEFVPLQIQLYQEKYRTNDIVIDLINSLVDYVQVNFNETFLENKELKFVSSERKLDNIGKYQFLRITIEDQYGNYYKIIYHYADINDPKVMNINKINELHIIDKNSNITVLELIKSEDDAVIKFYMNIIIKEIDITCYHGK